MINRIRHSAKPFLDKYLIVILLSFALLTMLPYISFLKVLQVNLISGMIYRGVLYGIFLITFLFVIVIYKSKIPMYVWIGCLIYITSQLLTIFISPVIKQVNIPTLTSLMGLGQTFIIGISVICYLTIFHNTEFNKSIIDYACIFMIVSGVLLCVYTYIFQYDSIYNTFNTIYGWNYDVTSIFTMKTEYGFMLFACSVFSVFYILNHKKYWMYVFPVFFLLNMFISRSKTSILCTSIIIITLLIVHMIQSWKNYKKCWIISLVSFGVVFIVFTILTSLRVGWFDKFNYYITQVIFNDACVVLDDRIHKWSLLINAIDNPFNIMFGYGERITPLLLSECGCATIGDNIYLSNYGVGGIIKFVLYIMLTIFIIRLSWKSKRTLITNVVVMIIQLSFLIGGLFEDDSVIGTNMSGLFSSIIFYSCNRIVKVDL